MASQRSVQAEKDRDRRMGNRMVPMLSIGVAFIFPACFGQGFSPKG